MEPTEVDPRQPGEVLWPEKHSKEKLLVTRDLDPIQFECLYQGNPSSAESRLYGEFKTYTDKTEWGTLIRKGALVDVADTGSDDLASITYEVYRSQHSMFNEQTRRFEPIIFVLVTDIILTPEGTEVTLVSVPIQVNNSGAQKVWVESNNGGTQFGNNLKKKIRASVEMYHTSTNKESKIITNASMVTQHIIMPYGWESKYQRAYEHITKFLRNFSANSHDDFEDALTEIYLKEANNRNPYNKSKRGVSRRN